MAKEKSKAAMVLGKIFGGLGVALCALMLALIIWILFDKLVNKSPAPSVFGVSVLRVLTGSMTGTINEGDFIVIKSQDSYGEQDVVTFLPTGASTPTTHRIVDVDEEGKFITKGDHNNTEDFEHISESQIIGKVMYVIAAGAAGSWFFEMGWLFILSMVIIVAMGIVLIKYDEELTAQKEKLAQMEAQGAQNAQNAESIESEQGENAQGETATESESSSDTQGETPQNTTENTQNSE